MNVSQKDWGRNPKRRGGHAKRETTLHPVFVTVCTSLFFSCGRAARLSASLDYRLFLVL